VRSFRRTYGHGKPSYMGRAVSIKAPRPRSALRALAMICGGVALGSAVYGGTVLAEWAVESDTFNLKEVRVCGERALSRVEILEAADVGPGVNVFRLRLDRIKSSVESLPGVKSCVVQRRLPDMLIIRVAERRPCFLVNCGGLWQVDRDGVVLGRAEMEDLDRFFMAGWRGDTDPLGSGGAAALAPGARLESGGVRRVVDAIDTIKRIAPELQEHVSEICVTDEGRLVLFTTEPSHRVLVGREGLKAESVVALGAVLDDLKRRGLTGMEVDLRFDRQLVVRSCGSTEASGRSS
jgi:hypothetical protein